ncbi:MAG: cysteine hydrolase family protein [Candidatus Pacebacteria bacterium]|nr:cysteine hydrolase family protein [Candidatus Paceibacterota bacterium]
MKPDALLVIDVQTALVEAKPYQKEQLLHNIRSLLAACRRTGIPVIYVQHNDEELVPGTAGWQVAAEIAPEAGEKQFEKQYSSAFRGTGLQQHLQSIKAQNLLICGMQTEYCVDTTIRVAFELGYNVTVPGGGTSTFDNWHFKADELIWYYENRIWDGRFAQVLPMKTILAEIEKVHAG